MIIMLAAIIIFPIILFLFIELNLLLEWEVHEDMVKNSCETWGYASFSTFLQEFEKRKEWIREERWPNSWFDPNIFGENEIHASVISFNGKGMIIRLFDYSKFLKWQKKNKLIAKKQIVQWDKEEKK